MSDKEDNTPHNTIIACNPKEHIEVNTPIKIDYKNLDNEDTIKEYLLLMYSFFS